MFQEWLRKYSANLTIPSAPSALASQHFIDGASTPPSQGEQYTSLKFQARVKPEK